MKQRLKQALYRRQKHRIVDAGLVPSAVLLPIFVKHGQYSILFTKRTEKVKEHKGEISFPGGAYQEEDGRLVDTALRECAEEIGLAGGDVEILGELDDTTTTKTSNYIISPFVAFIPYPYQFVLNGEEAEEIIEVPISALLNRDYIHEGTEIVDNKVVTSHSYHYKGRIIHGATARILSQFLDIIARIIDKESL